MDKEQAVFAPPGRSDSLLPRRGIHTFFRDIIKPCFTAEQVIRASDSHYRVSCKLSRQHSDMVQSLARLLRAKYYPSRVPASEMAQFPILVVESVNRLLRKPPPRVKPGPYANVVIPKVIALIESLDNELEQMHIDEWSLHHLKCCAQSRPPSLRVALALSKAELLNKVTYWMDLDVENRKNHDLEQGVSFLQSMRAMMWSTAIGEQSFRGNIQHNSGVQKAGADGSALDSNYTILKRNSIPTPSNLLDD